jgi:hypothetical protein
MARQSQIVRVVCSIMLFCNDVLNVVREFAVYLRKETVFATIAGPLPHKLPRGKLHRY